MDGNLAWMGSTRVDKDIAKVGWISESDPLALFPIAANAQSDNTGNFDQLKIKTFSDILKF